MTLDKQLHNFKTGEADTIAGGLSNLTDEAAKLYISQQPAAQNYFEIRRLLGDSIVKAMQATLTAQVGEIPAPPASATGGETTTTEEE